MSIIFDLNVHAGVVCIRGLIASLLNGGDIEVQSETHSGIARGMECTSPQRAAREIGKYLTLKATVPINSKKSIAAY